MSNKFNLEDIVVEKADPQNIGVVVRTPDETKNGTYKIDFPEGSLFLAEEEIEKR